MTKPIDIKTLDEILANLQPNSSSSACLKSAPNPPKKHKSTECHQPNHTQPPKKYRPKNTQTDHPTTNTAPPKKPTQPKKSAPATSTITPLLNDSHQSVLDDNTLRLLSKVEIEKLQIPDKSTRYMRWLAFYYLSGRDLSAWQLKQKLIAKECDPVAVDELLVEFAQKGYQSDERCATMLVREAVRKGRGVRHLSDSLKKAGLNANDFGGMDKLIQLADVPSLVDGTVLEDDDDDGINWLKLAVEARCKKYGDTPPKDLKEKARQLRFLQYRGFEMDVCFEALKLTLGDFDG